MANTYLTRTLATPTNRKKWTLSMWVKRSNISSASTSYLLSANSSQAYIYFNNNDTFNIEEYSGGYQYRLATNRVFRDTSAWYHLVISFDSTNATADDRVRIYINGVQETLFSARTNPSLNFDGAINNNNAHFIGREGASYWSGLISHIHFIDGTAYDATAFGQYDANGVWTIKDNISVSYGTNGFWILKDGNSVTDQSGNSNNFTVASGTLTNTEDNPSNVFATWNPLAQTFSSIGYEHGNTTIATSADVGQRQSISTLAASSGKFYMECKLQAIGSNVGGSFPYAGIVAQSKYAGNTYVGGNGCGWTTGGDVYNGGGSATSSGVSYTTGDIIGLAVDITNSKMYWHKNGTYIFSGNPSAGTGGFDISARTSEDAIGFATSLYNSNGTWQCNFGNGYFGTTVVSSAGTNASGNGIFEYDCPTGFTSLSTKGLNL